MPGRIVTTLLSLCLLVAALGCGGNGTKPRDAAHVEILRLKISKARHAIDETREAISRSAGAPYLPELYLRLAELISEEARYHYRVAQEREQGSTEALHVPQVRLLKERSISIYKMMLRRFKDSRIADKALFNMAYEHRELGNFDDMIAALSRLAKEYPNSRLRSEALLLLGDYHFDRSELQPSKTYYEQITKAPHSRVTSMAHYKLAWVWVNLGDCKKALTGFEGALEAERKAAKPPAKPKPEPQDGESAAKDGDPAAADKGPEQEPETLVAKTGGDEGQTVADERGIDVRRSALVDLVYCYSQERPAKKAVDYLRARAHDRLSYVAALAKMARRFEIMGQHAGARSVLRELLVLGPADQDRLDDARQMHSTLRAAKSFRGVGADLALMVAPLNRYTARTEVNAEMREQLRKEFEVYLRDLLTRAQEKVAKSPHPERDGGDLVLGYEAYVTSFPEAKESVAMLLNMADVLVIAGHHYQAGQRSLQAAHAMKKGDARRDSLYNALVHFQGALGVDASRDDLDNRVIARAALRRAGRELLDYKLEKGKQRRVKFAVAETLYQDGLYRSAIDGLTALAYEYPQSEESRAAIRLVLDSYNTMNDYRGLLQAGRRFLAEGSPADQALKAEIKPIVSSAEQLRLDEVSLEAAGDEGGDYQVLVAFARENKGSTLGERALINAFVAARALGQTTKLYQLGDEMARTYPASKQLPGMLSTLGQMAVARFEVDRAVSLLEKAAGTDHPQKLRLQLAQGQLQEELGDWQAARASYLKALQAGTEGRAAVEPVEHLARLLEKQGEYKDIIATLGGYADTGNPELLARLGLAQLGSGETEAAEQSLQNVLNAGTSASQDALARAHYGMAEIMRLTLESYPALTDPMLVEEYVTIVDVAQESYLNAAREGSVDYTVVALARLAYTMEKVAERVAKATFPAEMNPQEVKIIKEALAVRVQQLHATAKEARGACQQQSWAMHSFQPTSRHCLAGRNASKILPAFDSIQKRAGTTDMKAHGELLDRLGVNAEDLESLRALGKKLMAQGQAHVARMVFAAAAERGGGPVELNLLGIANYKVGDTAGALGSFARAAEGGLEAGRQNLKALLEKQGLAEAAKTALKRYPKGRAGGELLKP